MIFTDFFIAFFYFKCKLFYLGCDFFIDYAHHTSFGVCWRKNIDISVPYGFIVFNSIMRPETAVTVHSYSCCDQSPYVFFCIFCFIFWIEFWRKGKNTYFNSVLFCVISKLRLRLIIHQFGLYVLNAEQFFHCKLIITNTLYHLLEYNDERMFKLIDSHWIRISRCLI